MQPFHSNHGTRPWPSLHALPTSLASPPYPGTRLPHLRFPCDLRHSTGSSGPSGQSNAFGLLCLRLVPAARRQPPAPASVCMSWPLAVRGRRQGTGAGTVRSCMLNREHYLAIDINTKSTSSPHRSIMGFLKHLHSRSKIKEKELHAGVAYPVRTGADFIGTLPGHIVGNILTFVCPHSTDESYEPSERSTFSDGCMLCDLRDLAHCAQVRGSWRAPAEKLLWVAGNTAEIRYALTLSRYRSVRIDAVHYCELEQILGEKRRRKSRHGEPIDVPAIRLQLLSRTLRDNPHLAATVGLLKLPYMARETCKADLARAVSVLPNLRYVDLPEGFYSGDPTCHTLRQELQARCPEIRKMKYETGSEQAFELLQRRYWQHLEILEISRLHLEASTLRRVLATLPTLHELTLVDIPWLDDTVFQPSHALPDFPPLHKLSLEDIPHVTAAGLENYLTRLETREVLTDLSLTNTGITIPELNRVVWAASHLQHLSIIETVSFSLPLDPLPPLMSITLQTLHYEITSSETIQSLQKPSDSYYAYLRGSLLQNSLPALRALYVRDPGFADSLLLAPPAPAFRESPARPVPRGFTQPLEVYSKGLDELEWVFTAVAPSGVPGRRGSASGGRPLSAYSASRGLGPQWGGEARKSVVVGNGFGGFLAVPSEESPARQRPGSAGSWHRDGDGAKDRRGSRHDLWR